MAVVEFSLISMYYTTQSMRHFRDKMSLSIPDFFTKERVCKQAGRSKKEGGWLRGCIN